MNRSREKRFWMRSTHSLSIKPPARTAFVMSIKKHSPHFSPHLCKSFTDFSVTGEIPKESLKAVIVTIPKLGKSQADPANYRPSSLHKHRLQGLCENSCHLCFPIYSPISPPRSGWLCSTETGPRWHQEVYQPHSMGRASSYTFSAPFFGHREGSDRVPWLYLIEILQKFGLQRTFSAAVLSLYPSS